MAQKVKTVNKSTKSKAVVGKKKQSLLSRLSWKKKAYLGSAGLLLILTIGYAGSAYWQHRQLKAAAAGWTTIASSNNGALVACKQYTNSAYGALWKTKMWLIGGSNASSAEVKIKRGTSTVNTTRWSANPGQWVYRETYASVYYNDRLEGGATFKINTGENFNLNYSQITTC